MILAICLGGYFFVLFTNQSKMMMRKGFFGFSFGLMIFMLILVTTMDVRAVQNGGYKDIVIKTSNETYISSDTNYFIGKTEDFLFIYRPRDFSTIVLPSNKKLSNEPKVETRYSPAPIAQMQCCAQVYLLPKNSSAFL